MTWEGNRAIQLLNELKDCIAPIGANIIEKICDYIEVLECDLESAKDRATGAYSDGYEDGAHEEQKYGERSRHIFIGQPETYKQPHGFITHNNATFGFGDTAEESLIDFMTKVKEVSCQ